MGSLYSKKSIVFMKLNYQYTLINGSDGPIEDCEEEKENDPISLMTGSLKRNSSLFAITVSAHQTCPFIIPPASFVFLPHWVHKQSKIMKGRASFLGEKLCKYVVFVAITFKRYHVICPQGIDLFLRSNQFIGLTSSLLLNLTPSLSPPLPYYLPL